MSGGGGTVWGGEASKGAPKDVWAVPGRTRRVPMRDLPIEGTQRAWGWPGGGGIRGSLGESKGPYTGIRTSMVVPRASGGVPMGGTPL